MGRALQIRPARVLETVTQELASGVMSRYRRTAPPWLEALQRIPPAEKLARTVPIKHQNIDESRMKAPRRSFIPQRLKYEEDHLRRVFYKHHPWELARPRIIAESDGRDAERVHWGRGLRQPGMALTGEKWVASRFGGVATTADHQ
jgi:small subunit ribosomal protein S23